MNADLDYATRTKQRINDIAHDLGENCDKIMAYCLQNHVMLVLDGSRDVRRAVLHMLAKQFLVDYDWEILSTAGGPPVLMVLQKREPQALYPAWR